MTKMCKNCRRQNVSKDSRQFMNCPECQKLNKKEVIINENMV